MNPRPGILIILLLTASFYCHCGAFADILQPVPAQASGDYGYFHVTSSPNGADVVFDGRFVGETPITVPVFSSGTPGHTITVSKIGYVTWTQSFSRNPVAGQTIPISATLPPRDATGSIQVTTSPSGALVNLDGTMAQMSPWTYTGVPTGGHVIQAFLSGFSPYSGPVEVIAGQTTDVSIVLYPLTSTGALQVVTSPGGADLYIDGIYQGKTSLAIGSIATGTHGILVKHFGYQDLRGDVIINEGKTTYLSFSMIPFTEPTTGNLRISSNPAGAGIYIDDSYNGVTHAGEYTTFTGLAPGPHSVELKLSNYQGYSENIEIAAGLTSTVDADLAPSPNPGPFASLEISSVPSGASVVLDNQVRGITPLSLDSVPAGKHNITTRMTGFQDYMATIQLSPGQNVLISAALVPVPTSVPVTTVPLEGCMVTLSLVITGVILRRNKGKNAS